MSAWMLPCFRHDDNGLKP
ncbi:rCG48831 [Rattus norvegicus]|uniref:RCG48831 n=1 Tax=Rattus norvegicus TaxID=10116 RepID=A6IFW4_RAT|nr:rCG48831 [Rattus norvegicus]